jgi:hypothetical protein
MRQNETIGQDRRQPARGLNWPPPSAASAAIIKRYEGLLRASSGQLAVVD